MTHLVTQHSGPHGDDPEMHGHETHYREHDMSDLVQQLRATDAVTPTPEVERLRVERDGFVQYGAARDEENAVLRARVKRLEGALKAYVAFGCPVCAGDCASVNPQPTHCPTIRARAALGGE